MCTIKSFNIAYTQFYFQEIKIYPEISKKCSDYSKKYSIIEATQEPPNYFKTIGISTDQRKTRFNF